MIKADVLIIGSEGAGALAAMEVKKLGLNPMILTKGRIAKCGATVTAGADINVDGHSARKILGLNGDVTDSKEQFFADTVIEGRYINNQKMVEHHVEMIPEIVKEMLDWGMKVMPDLQQPAGHSHARGVTTKGEEIMRVLAKTVKEAKIPIYEHFMATDLIRKDGQVVGVAGLDLSTGDYVEVAGKAVIIATGGGMQLYPYSTAPDELTGDGHAMAWRAGAQFIDMEMVQFMGCTFLDPPAVAGSSFPYCLGPDANGLDIRMLNKFGHRFFEEKIDPINKEHVTRDLLSRGIMNEVYEGNGSPLGGVYYSISHLPKNIVENWPAAKNMPIVSLDWEFMGYKYKDIIDEMMKGNAIEVAVASHFFCGGIRANDLCDTGIPGLYAAGEVVGGTEGANRLSGNALTQVFVQGVLAARSAAEYAKKASFCTDYPKEGTEEYQERILAPLYRDGISAIELKKQIQKDAWDNICVVRTEESIRRNLENIAEYRKQLPLIGTKCKSKVYNREWVDAIQVESLLTLSEIISVSALARPETRGAHYRKDYDFTDNRNYLKNVIVSNESGKAIASYAPLIITSITPPQEVKHE